MSDTTGPQPYEQSRPPRKSRKVFWIVGGLVIATVLLGTCINGGVKAFQAVSARSEATDKLVRQYFADGLPAATDPIYSRRIEITQKAVDDTNRYIRQYGAVSEFSDAACNVRSAANTDAAKSGTFADCTLTVVSEHSPGVVSVQWVREDEMWKIIGMNVTYSDQRVLLDKAEQADAKSEAAAEPETDTAAEE